MRGRRRRSRALGWQLLAARMQRDPTAMDARNEARVETRAEVRPMPSGSHALRTPATDLGEVGDPFVAGDMVAEDQKALMSPQTS